MELVGIEPVEHRPQLEDFLPHLPGEGVPKALVVCLGAVVFHHGLGALPHGGHQGLRLKAKGRGLFRQQAKVGVGKLLQLHGEQGAVQIEQHRGNLWV